MDKCDFTEMQEAAQFEQIVEDDSAWTVTEFAQKTGRDRGVVREHFERAVAAGRMERIRVRRKDTLGREQPVFAYRPKERGK